VTDCDVSDISHEQRPPVVLLQTTQCNVLARQLMAGYGGQEGHRPRLKDDGRDCGGGGGGDGEG
jgi:hypothetical protein